MSKPVNHVGVDVGSKTLVIETQLSSTNVIQKGTFDNTSTGHKKLLKFITKHNCHAKVCVESTGLYHLELALLLARSEKVNVMVANPKAMHHFATAMLQRAKTDKYDAHTILSYVMRMDFIEWLAPSEDAVKIYRYSRRIAQIQKLMAQEQARLPGTDFQGRDGKVIKKSIEQCIKIFQKQIQSLRKSSLDIINASQTLKDKFARMKTVIGIADVSALQLLAEILMMPSDLAANQWVAFSGLDPKPHESGSSINKPRRVSKHGNKYIRSALYMPALVAIRHEENVAAYYHKLLTMGKKKMQAIVAVMRKLLLAIWGMLNSKTDWDGKKFYKIQNIENNA